MKRYLSTALAWLKKHKAPWLILLGWAVLMLPAMLYALKPASHKTVCFYAEKKDSTVKDDFVLDFYDALPEKQFYYVMVKDLPAKLLWQGEERDAAIRALAPHMCNDSISDIRKGLPIQRLRGYWWNYRAEEPYTVWLTETVAEGTEARAQMILNGDMYAVSVYRTLTVKDAAGTVLEAYLEAVNRGLFDGEALILFADDQRYLEYASAVCGETFDDMSQLAYDGALILLPSTHGLSYGGLRRMVGVFEQNGFSVKPEQQTEAGERRYYRAIAGYTGTVTAAYVLILSVRRCRKKGETAQ